MRALVCTEYGEPERLRIGEQVLRSPGPNEVVVEVAAAGLGFVDALHVAGRYQLKLPLPFVPGSEVAGVIVEVGSAVRGLTPGQRVLGNCAYGALAERAILTESACVLIPEAMTDAQAASFPTSYATALFALKNCGRLQPGEVVLVLGAAGGVGLAAIDVAKAMGARVIAAASSQLKRDLCLERGADAVVDYTRGDWRSVLKQLSGGGVNIVFDPVGGVFAEPALRSLAPGGRFLVVGFASGEIPAVSLNLPLLKRVSIVGVDLGGTLRAEPNAARALFAQLIDWVVAGRIHPRPGAVYRLEQASEALAAILARQVAGKVVVMLR